jgi:hypothetical protein
MKHVRNSQWIVANVPSATQWVTSKGFFPFACEKKDYGNQPVFGSEAPSLVYE